jgi:hypothetical protein
VEFTPDRAAIRQPRWARELMVDYFANAMSGRTQQRDVR